ncbi:MAG TPA: hypothetical protein DEO40_02090, partial [Treponema sp.]|nr:hypothetical protein [Treponema sp.]
RSGAEGNAQQRFKGTPSNASRVRPATLRGYAQQRFTGTPFLLKILNFSLQKVGLYYMIAVISELTRVDFTEVFI